MFDDYYFGILCSLCNTYFTLCLQKHSKKEFSLHQLAKGVWGIVCAKKDSSGKALLLGVAKEPVKTRLKTKRAKILLSARESSVGTKSSAYRSKLSPAKDMGKPNRIL